MEKQESDIKVKSLNPRRYQIEVFDVAKKRNTIAVLETGTGKTLIAVMLMREIGQSFESLDQKKLVVFLAPTVTLVIQQFETIKAQTEFRVGQYYGAMKVEDWTAEHWENEVTEHDVLVTTPQVLLDALRKAFLCLEIAGLLIFDECHRASGNHPYTKIMKEFDHKSSNKPKVLGMTATPAIKKGVSSNVDCENQISELESILDSQVYTTKDRKEIEAFIPSAKEIHIYYDQALPYTDIKSRVNSSWSKGICILSYGKMLVIMHVYEMHTLNRNPIGHEMQGNRRAQERMIDLHGLHVIEALHVLKHELNVLRTTARAAKQCLQAYICVGTSHHTRGSRTLARLPTTVQRYLLEEEGLDYSEPQRGVTTRSRRQPVTEGSLVL